VLLTFSLVGTACSTTTRPTDAETLEIGLPPVAVSIAHTSVDLVRTLRYSAPTAARVYAYVMLAAGRAHTINQTDPDGAAIDAAARMMDTFSTKPFVVDAFDVLRRAYHADQGAADGLVAALLDRERGDRYDTTLQSLQPIGKTMWSWQPTGLQRTPFQHPGFADLPLMSPSSGRCDIPAPDLAVIEAEGRRMLLDLDLDEAISPRVIAWLGGPGSPTPSGLWLLLAASVATREGLDDAATMRLLAAVAVAEYDAAIVTWREKREHDLARPETMWQRWTGEEIVLPRETPPHPSYPSGHSTFSGAAAAVLRALHGDTELALTLQEEVGRPAEKYRYPNLAAAVADVNASRVMAGFHYPLDTKMGEQLGDCIGTAVAKDIDTLLEGRP
jgi:membrane-associated phospholipid phosphatase